MNIITHPHGAGESLFELTYRNGIGVWASILRYELGNIRLVGYARVSSGNQLQGYSIGEQFNEMEFFANHLSCPLISKCGGKCSSRQVTRKPLHDAINCCRVHRAQLMVAYQSRLARHGRLLGYYCHLLGMMGIRAFALYPDSERMRRSLDQRRQHNLCLGNVPLGMTKDGNGRLVRDARDHELCRIITDLKWQGHSYESIATWLNQNDHRTKEGEMWTRRVSRRSKPATFRRMKTSQLE